MKVTIEELIEQEKKMPNPNMKVIEKLESFIKTGTITVKAGDTHHTINSDKKNY